MQSSCFPNMLPLHPWVSSIYYEFFNLWAPFPSSNYFPRTYKEKLNLAHLAKKKSIRKKSLGSVLEISPAIIEHPTTTNTQPMFHEPRHEIVFSFHQNGGHMEVCTHACPNPNITCATNNTKTLNQQNVDRPHPKHCRCHQEPNFVRRKGWTHGSLHLRMSNSQHDMRNQQHENARLTQ